MINILQSEALQYLAGPAGQLEAAVSVPDKSRSQWAIVCHPHPLFGGTMYNKVVTTLVKTLQTLGMATVRFNFRGVGKSEGAFDNGVGELQDLLAVIRWVENQSGIAAPTLAGFSFGAYVAAMAATQVTVKQLITIAPPVINFAMENVPPIQCPWVLVQGEQDEVVPAAAVLAWARAREPKPVILTFPRASHFFHGQLVELQDRLLMVLE